MIRKYGKDGLALTEKSEGCKLEAYPDPKWHKIPRTASNWHLWGKPWTIGYGHTHGVTEGMTCTHDQAVQWLLGDVEAAVSAVNRLVTVELSQDEFDALVDFVFNLGEGAFAGSTLLKKLNAGDYAGACAEIDKWDHSDGRVLAGLFARRHAETSLFEKGMKE